jgi:hypothetical protein
MASKSLQKDTLQMFEMMDKGLSAADARKLVKPDKKVTRQADYLLAQKYKQWSLTHPKRVQKASKVYDNALAGKPLTANTDDKPTNQQILGVAKDILERQEPKVTRTENLNVSVDLSPVDLSKYRR